MERKEFYGITTFLFKNASIMVQCWSTDGRVGFQHRAKVYFENYATPYKNKFYKVQYYNRTWEKYRFQSLLMHVLESLKNDKAITEEDYNQFKKEVKEF